MPNNQQNKSLKRKMTVDTQVSLDMCVLLLIDMIDGCQNNKGHPRKLSSGDERTLRKTFNKLQKETSLFTFNRIKEGEKLNHVDLNLSSDHQGLPKNVIFSSDNHFFLQDGDPRQT